MWDSLLDGIEKPGRYLGHEGNACCRSFDHARVRFALAFPDVYEVGLSHLGLQILYHRLNSLDGVLADRVYTPWPDYEERLRKTSEPLRALETQRPLRDFDFVGFSLQYELSYTNVLTMLDLAGIPIRAADRDSRHPWVIAGGPVAFNPEPLAEISILWCWEKRKRCLKSWPAYIPSGKIKVARGENFSIKFAPSRESMYLVSSTFSIATKVQ
jgi:hypothetical protein